MGTDRRPPRLCTRQNLPDRRLGAGTRGRRTGVPGCELAVHTPGPSGGTLTQAQAQVRSPSHRRCPRQAVQRLLMGAEAGHRCSGSAGGNPGTRERGRAPYQDHVAGGDVHVGRHGLLAPGRGAAPRGWAGQRPIAELRRHAVDAGRMRGLGAVGRAHGHALAAQLLEDRGTRVSAPALPRPPAPWPPPARPQSHRAGGKFALRPDTRIHRPDTQVPTLRSHSGPSERATCWPSSAPSVSRPWSGGGVCIVTETPAWAPHLGGVFRKIPLFGSFIPPPPITPN